VHGWRYGAIANGDSHLFPIAERDSHLDPRAFADGYSDEYPDAHAGTYSHATGTP
jgi:hypothetical protein